MTDQICVPNPPSFISSDEWNGTSGSTGLKDEAVIYNSAYSTGYLVSKYIPILLEGVPDIIENDVTLIGSTIVQSILIFIIPYVIVFLVLIGILMYNKTISISIGILLLILVIVITAICVIWALTDISGSVSNIPTQITIQITNNFNNTKDSFEQILITAITNPDSIACK